MPGTEQASRNIGRCHLFKNKRKPCFRFPLAASFLLHRNLDYLLPSFLCARTFVSLTYPQKSVLVLSNSQGLSPAFLPSMYTCTEIFPAYTWKSVTVIDKDYLPPSFLACIQKSVSLLVSLSLFLLVTWCAVQRIYFTLLNTLGGKRIFKNVQICCMCLSELSPLYTEDKDKNANWLYFSIALAWE